MHFPWAQNLQAGTSGEEAPELLDELRGEGEREPLEPEPRPRPRPFPFFFFRPGGGVFPEERALRAGLLSCLYGQSFPLAQVPSR